MIVVGQFVAAQNCYSPRCDPSCRLPRGNVVACCRDQKFHTGYCDRSHAMCGRTNVNENRWYATGDPKKPWRLQNNKRC